MGCELKSIPYNTNLAAEFWVLSALYRVGVDAHLTLGNKKSVDILIFYDSQIIYTIDVKGLAGPYDWPADNIKEIQDPNHYYVFIESEGKIGKGNLSRSSHQFDSLFSTFFLDFRIVDTIVQRLLSAMLIINFSILP